MLINSDNPTSTSGETNHILGSLRPRIPIPTREANFIFIVLVQIELVNALSNLLACLPQEHSNQWSREFSTIGLTRLSPFRLTSNRDGMSRCQVPCLSVVSAFFLLISDVALIVPSSPGPWLFPGFFQVIKNRIRAKKMNLICIPWLCSYWLSSCLFWHRIGCCARISCYRRACLQDKCHRR